MPGQGLGTVREDLVTALSMVLGRSTAEAKVAEIERLVQDRAAAGTVAAVDTKLPAIRANVQAEVKKIVTPFFVGAMIVGSAALVVGVAAIVARRR